MLTNGIFQEKLKVAKEILVFKSGDDQFQITDQYLYYLPYLKYLNM